LHASGSPTWPVEKTNSKTRGNNTNLALAFLNVYLIPQHHKRKILRIMRTCLDKEFVPPTVEGLKGLGAVNIIYKDAAVCATVKRNTERLEPLLTSSVPELMIDQL